MNHKEQFKAILEDIFKNTNPANASEVEDLLDSLDGLLANSITKIREFRMSPPPSPSLFRQGNSVQLDEYADQNVIDSITLYVLPNGDRVIAEDKESITVLNSRNLSIRYPKPKRVQPK